MSEVEKVEVEEREFNFSLHIGYQSRQEDTITVEIPVGLTEDEEQEVIGKAWREWIWEYVDGGWDEVGHE